MKSKYIKLLALIMVLCMCLFAAGCGGSENDGGEEAADQEAGQETEEESSTDISGYIGDFVTSDLDGNEVTGAIFGEKDVTIVNVWGTFCPPCIGELPDLQEMSESLPENAQMIGILCDVTERKGDEYKDALDLISENGITYRNLLISDSMKFTEKLMYVPTTLLVDKDGNVIGDPIVGAAVENYKKALEEYLAGL